MQSKLPAKSHLLRYTCPRIAYALCITIVLSLFGCSSKIKSPSKPVTKLRLGYLLNMTHAVPIVGIEENKFSNIETQNFVSGNELLNALITDNLDLGYIGPGPYINALTKGIKLKLLKVSALGANSLILPASYQRDKIYYIHKIAVPQYGNTQDLLAKILIKNVRENRRRHSELIPQMREVVELPLIRFARDLEFVAVNPAELETVFFLEDVDAALVTEPWGTMLESKGLINLASLAHSVPNIIEELEGSRNSFVYKQLDFINQFPASLLVVNEDFYRHNQSLVDKFVYEQNQIFDFIKASPQLALADMQAHIKNKAHKTLEQKFLSSSFAKVKFSDQLDITRMQDLSDAAYRAKYFRKKLVFQYS